MAKKNRKDKSKKPDHDVRDMERELAFCLKNPNRKDPENVRLVLSYIRTQKLQPVLTNSRLRVGDRALLSEALILIERLVNN